MFFVQVLTYSNATIQQLTHLQTWLYKITNDITARWGEPEQATLIVTTIHMRGKMKCVWISTNHCICPTHVPENCTVYSFMYSAHSQKNPVPHPLAATILPHKIMSNQPRELLTTEQPATRAPNHAKPRATSHENF